jgi:hypothetical protein
VTRQIGYVASWTLGPIDPPTEYAGDQEVQARLRGPVGAPDLIEANRQIRLFGWAAFAAALLLALLVRTSTVQAVAAAWVGLCLVLHYLTLTWFWPWYVLWGLMPAALVPRSMLTRLTVYLAWGVTLAYALLGFQDSRFWYLNNYRAVLMFGLPLILFAIDEALRLTVWLTRLTSRKLRRSSPPASEPEPDASPMSARLRAISGPIRGENP